jgi:hypothetical protein
MYVRGCVALSNKPCHRIPAPGKPPLLSGEVPSTRSPVCHWISAKRSAPATSLGSRLRKHLSSRERRHLRLLGTPRDEHTSHELAHPAKAALLVSLASSGGLCRKIVPPPRLFGGSARWLGKEPGGGVGKTNCQLVQRLGNISSAPLFDRTVTALRPSAMIQQHGRGLNKYPSLKSCDTLPDTVVEWLSPW